MVILFQIFLVRYFKYLWEEGTSEIRVVLLLPLSMVKTLHQDSQRHFHSLWFSPEETAQNWWHPCLHLLQGGWAPSRENSSPAFLFCPSLPQAFLRGHGGRRDRKGWKCIFEGQGLNVWCAKHDYFWMVWEIVESCEACGRSVMKDLERKSYG